MGQLSADQNGARQVLASDARREANAWALKTGAREGPSVGKPSETSGSRRKRNVGKPSETSGRRREAVGNVGKPSETPGSRQKRREAAGKPSDSFQKPRNASMSENAVGKQMICAC